ncbi:hypothetical protein PPACK8108_LOCUS24163, partial [Phakopsora pachyrhizi]
YYGGSRRSSTESDESYSPGSSPTASSINSVQQTTLETLLDILERQESRLDMLERFGRSIWKDSSYIPIFRGLKSKSPICSDTLHPNRQRNEIDVKDWCELVLSHLNCARSLNPELDSKDLIRFIEAHLDLEPLKLIHTLLRRNRLLVRSNYPQEVPITCKLDEGALEADDRFLYDYPFKLYVLRFPRALLNMIQSKFENQDHNLHGSGSGDKKLSISPGLKDRIHLQPQDSLLRKPIHHLPT